MADLIHNAMAVILAGGGGERVNVLAQGRAKPAIPFSAKYRIIDFTLSNCVNSGIRNVAIVTQYQPLSLIEHVGVGRPWDLDQSGRVVRVLQARLTRNGRGWYQGTADAIYQNLEYIEEQDDESVLILGGDHVYRMDYSDMLTFHREKEADVTLAVTPMPEADIKRFGTAVVDQTGQVMEFQEKVKKPKSNLAFMGVYVFKRDILQQWLMEDDQNVTSKHDLSGDVIPNMVGRGKIFAYRFDRYWRDVGTVQAYWQANMDLLQMSPSPLFSSEWPIRTREDERPPAIISATASVVNSMICNGCVIDGSVEQSILSPGVTVLEGALVKDSIIMSDTTIGPHSIIDRSILDKEIVVEAGCHIGYGSDVRTNFKASKLRNTGITVIGKRAKIPPGIKIGCSCVIHCDIKEEDFPASKIKSGQTIRAKRRGHARRT
ncbi:glucose-1-phosphate adenylyltransferase family protein [Chloroflexota bacterium]